MTKREHVHNDFPDSGVATSVCRQNLTTVWMEKPRGLEVVPRSALDVRSRRLAARRIVSRDGVTVAGNFQIAPKGIALQRSIISVGQVCDSGKIITFRSVGRTTFIEFTGNRIEFERVGGVYRLRADTWARRSVEVLMELEQVIAGAAEAQPGGPGNALVL